jgi:hypothetical protein
MLEAHRDLYLRLGEGVGTPDHAGAHRR